MQQLGKREDSSKVGNQMQFEKLRLKEKVIQDLTQTIKSLQLQQIEQSKMHQEQIL